MSHHPTKIAEISHKIILWLALAVIEAAGGVAYAEQGNEGLRKLPCDKPSFGLIRFEYESTSCRCIIQDHQGFLWVGTDNGIVRYDGEHIDRFGSIETGLRSYGRKVVALAGDSANNCIWASLDGCAALAKVDTRTFETTILEYETADDDEADTYRVTLSLTNIDDSTLICRMARAFYAINKRTGHAELLKKYKGAINSARTPFFQYDGRLCNVGGGKLYGMSRTKGSKVSVEEIQLSGIDRIKDAVPKDDTTLIVLNMSLERRFDINLLHLKSGKKEFLGSITDSPHGMASADDGLWIATNHGLIMLRYDDKTIKTFTSANSTLKDNDLACITKANKQHIFFLGTADGIATLNYFNSKFLRTDMRRYSVSSNPQVWSLAKDSRGTSWVGCIDGLYRLRDNSIFYEKVGLGNAPEETDEMILAVNETLECDGLIVATPKDAYKIGYDGHIIRHILHDDDMVRGAQPLRRGKIAVICRHSIHIIDTATWQETGCLKSGKGVSFTAAHTDDMSTLWVVNSRQELAGYDLTSLERRYIVVLQKDSIGAIREIRHNVLNGMDELWIATSSAGLLYKNPGYSGIMPVNNGKVLKSMIHSMELDANGGLWVSTDFGIANVRDGKVTDFPKSEYQLCNKFLNRASAKGVNGEILMGGRNDFIEFTPLSFVDNDYFPTPQVTSYQYFNFTDKPAPEDCSRKLYGGGSVVVPANVNSIRINARSMSFDHPESTNVEWMIDNDITWKKSEPTGDIYLAALDEGSHKLYLRSTDDSGRPQAGVCALTIEKETFFYKSRVFLFLIIAATASIIAGLWAWRNRQYKRIKQKLTRDVNVVSDMLMAANSELRKRQAEINQRNIEISAMNSNLQDMVERRTRDLEQAKAKAEESSQLKSDFLASLGHEVRTPMNAIVGFAKLLQMDKCSDEDRTEFADLILKSATSLLGMLSALLDSSRIERGVLEISFSETNIAQEVNDTYKMLSVEKKNPNVEFQLNLAENLKGAVIETDKERLRQIIINITYNAFKFTSSGYVRMSAWKAKASALTRIGLPQFPQSLNFTSDVFVMSVEDTGLGIPEDKREIIFEPFRRLTGNLIKHPGLGLGLSIVKNLVGLMGGEIWLTSEVGKGSTFFFYLPFDRQKTEKNEQRKQAQG